MSAIYAIKNLINNKIYIGSSKSPIKRKYQHFYYLKKGIHHSQYLQRSYDKYGKDKFSFYILEECSDEDRYVREIFYINHYKSHICEYGYNTYEPDGENFTCSKETKQKLSDSSSRKIAIDLYKTNGEFIKSFQSILSCVEYLISLNVRVKNTGIFSQILSGKRKSYKGFTIVKLGEPLVYSVSPKQRNMNKFIK